MATVLLWECLLLGFIQLAGGDTSQKMPLAEVVDKLTKRENLFFDSQSLHIKCSWGETDHLFLSEADNKRLLQMMRRSEVDPSAFPQQKIFRTPGYRYELGKKGAKLFQKVTNPLDLKYGALGLTAAFDGSIGVELQERYHAIIGKEPPAYAWQNWDYAFLLHLNIYKYVTGLDPKTRIPAGIRALNLPEDIVESRKEYSLTGDDSTMGAGCLLLDKSDVARFWLDPKLGCAIRRVDMHIPGKKRVPGSLKTSVTMADFREVRPGLWLPWAITEELYYSSERGPIEQVGKPAVRRTLSVESIEFDTLTDEFFQISIPADVRVHDNIRNIEYLNQKEGVPFSQAIEFANQHRERHSQTATVLLLVGNVGLVCILVCLFFFRRSRSKPNP
jgi:hypothetical protein